MIKVGIGGVTGYTGADLVRLLARHPETRVVAGTTEQYQGQSFSQVYPSFQAQADFPLVPLSAEAFQGCDVVFLALPHAVAIDMVPGILAAGARVIDLGADFRLQSGADYQAWYKHPPAPAELLARAAYGLPELFRAAIRGASLVANPGCYPTTCALAAAPLLKAGLVETTGIIFNSASGVSGAGRAARTEMLFGEVSENFRAYNIAGAHRHTPEIEQSCSWLAGAPVRVTFTPHLLPITRGILTTAYFQLKQELTTAQALDLYREFYRDEPFVRVRPQGDLPQTKQVYGSNFADIGLQVDGRTGRIVVLCAEDNLGKGASGQAVQNMNIVCGLPETTGLLQLPVYP